MISVNRFFASSLLVADGYEIYVRNAKPNIIGNVVIADTRLDPLRQISLEAMGARVHVR